MWSFCVKTVHVLSARSWIVWLVLSAVLFLAGSAVFELFGSRELAQVSVIGAVAAVAVIAAFAG